MLFYYVMSNSFAFLKDLSFHMTYAEIEVRSLTGTSCSVLWGLGTKTFELTLFHNRHLLSNFTHYSVFKALVENLAYMKRGV